MSKNILELGIYIAIMSLLLGIVALINVISQDLNTKKVDYSIKGEERIELQNKYN